jgi:hypothetical protein
MTDLVQRLREAAALSLNEYGEADRYVEAADEIDRLRHLVDALGRALAVAEGTEVEEPKP